MFPTICIEDFSVNNKFTEEPILVLERGEYLSVKKKVASLAILILLLLGMLSFTFNIKPAKAEWTGTVYIRADGSIDPPDAPISTIDKVTYRLTGNIISDADGIIVERSNIIIDGNGYTLHGPGKIDPSKVVGRSWSGVGINLTQIDHVTIKRINIEWFEYGVVMKLSSNNDLIENNINDNAFGVDLHGSSFNNVYGNNIINNFLGISIGSGWGTDATYNNIIKNKISGNMFIGLLISWCSNNVISENNITNNALPPMPWAGIVVEASSGNKFYHNNIIENMYINIDILHDPRIPVSINIWDDGYPSGGNYWSDYTGVDVKSGSNQDLPGSDGIGDTPYIIDEYNRDRYPLMKPYAPPSVLLPPVASFSYNPSNPKVNEKVSFDASASYDPDGQIVSYKWSFGDGSIDEGKTVTHAYSKEGNYKVTLMVIDNDGKSCSTSKTVTVVKPTPTANRLKILDKYFDILNKSTGWTQSGSFYYLNYEPDGKRLPRSSKTVSGYTTVDDGDIYPSQCVDFVRVLSNTIYIKTKDWRQGPNVMTATDIEPGTVVATFKDGKYPADGTGHVAVFAGFTYSDGRKTGFKVFDQNWTTDGGLGVVGKHFVYTIGSGVSDADNYYIVTLEGISIKATCPVDLEVIDPDSLKICKEFSEIPEAIYIEEDLNDDGYLDDYIFIPEQKIGEYLISVIPEPDADPNATYTLEVSSADMTLILAENVPLRDIPTEPYIIASATFETPPPPSVITATIDVDPDNLNLGSKGKWVTAYIELPEGYDVSNINVSTIMLNNTISMDLEAPIEIGDYDNDTIPDLMVKFDRATVCNFILSKGIRYGNVTLVLSGKFYDGTLFEGYDTIRVRMPGDLNMDGKVDMKDISIAAKAFGSYPEHPRWNPIADENEDNKIDIFDIALTCRNFGKTYK
jgi:parallel beta-helix repeat protein